jgi:hypothetical protein
LRREQRDADVAVEGDVACEEDDPHAAPPEFAR